MFRVFPQNFPLGLFYLIDIHVHRGHLVNASLHLLRCHELNTLSPTVQTNNYEHNQVFPDKVQF